LCITFRSLSVLILMVSSGLYWPYGRWLITRQHMGWTTALSRLVFGVLMSIKMTTVDNGIFRTAQLKSTILSLHSGTILAVVEVNVLSSETWTESTPFLTAQCGGHRPKHIKMRSPMSYSFTPLPWVSLGRKTRTTWITQKRLVLRHARISATLILPSLTLLDMGLAYVKSFICRISS
jgi:hypothetical protein